MKSRTIPGDANRRPEGIERVGVFFDRDGTLNTEVDYLSRPEELQLLPHAARAIREANSFGVKVFVITNQSGVARGLLTEEMLAAIHRRLVDLLANHGARVDGIYYCPHHPDSGSPPYKKVCNCRKPKTGMLLQAAREHDVDLRNSFVIGDRCIDMQAGVSAGCGTALVLTGYGAVERDECLRRTRVDFVAEDAFIAWHAVKEQLTMKFLNQ
ncbi:MAG: HAD family hydrolase [Lysobacteraceae bacterium]|nr:MAG: HAD family hydrolase [Xanthomonadaceae bacterium]